MYAYCPSCEIIHDIGECIHGQKIRCRVCGKILIVIWYPDGTVQLHLWEGK